MGETGHVHVKWDIIRKGKELRQLRGDDINRITTGVNRTKKERTECHIEGKVARKAKGGSKMDNRERKGHQSNKRRGSRMKNRSRGEEGGERKIY